MGLGKFLKWVFVGLDSEDETTPIKPKKLIKPSVIQNQLSQLVTTNTNRSNANPALASLREKLGITENELWFFAFLGGEHYTRHYIKKRSGGIRRIDSPDLFLKKIQRRILNRFLNDCTLHENSHGFRKDRSVITAVQPHVGQDVVVTVDIKRFFPSIKAKRVAGLFRAVQFSKEESYALRKLTTFKGKLPTGAPTSPAISNMICRRMDARLSGLARSAGGTYTRYADDMAFSGDRKFRWNLKWMIPKLREIIEAEGFAVPKKNISINGKSGRQKFLGVVLNSGPSVPREERRRLRAAVHDTSKNPCTSEDLMKLKGKISWVTAVNSTQGKRLSDALELT